MVQLSHMGQQDNGLCVRERCMSFRTSPPTTRTLHKQADEWLAMNATIAQKARRPNERIADRGDWRVPMMPPQQANKNQVGVHAASNEVGAYVARIKSASTLEESSRCSCRKESSRRLCRKELSRRIRRTETKPTFYPTASRA